MKFLDETPKQLSIFKTKNLVEMNDDSRRAQNTKSRIKFKTSMLRSILFDYNNAYITVNETMVITGDEVVIKQNRPKK